MTRAISMSMSPSSMLGDSETIGNTISFTTENSIAPEDIQAWAAALIEEAGEAAEDEKKVGRH